MKRAASFLSLIALMSGVEACDWLPVRFGATAQELQSKLGVQLPVDLPKSAGQTATHKRKLDADQASQRLVFPGRQICPTEAKLADALITYHFAYDHLYRVEVVSKGRPQLLRLAQSVWGPALRSKRIFVDAERPLYRWSLPSAFVTYRGTSKDKAWHETLDILGKGQQAFVQRLHQARQPGASR